MLEPLRRGRLQQPSGQFHGSSFNIVPVGIRGVAERQAMLRLSAPLAAFVVVWTQVTGTAVDAQESAFIATMLGFAWHAGVHVTWGSER